MASTQPAPSSQQSGVRPISFVLVDNSNPSGSILASNTLTLYVRPEDLTRSDTSRLSVQQTLGSTVWADNFGEGVPTINISGHTGWRRPDDPSLGSDDGVDRFKKLRDQVFTNWHARRKVAIQNGKDPDATVQLQFADQLDSIAAVVAPMSFVLRRSRARPLLMQYQISMIVTQDNIAQASVAQSAGNLTNSVATLTTAQQLSAGLASLTSSINDITSLTSLVGTFVDGSIASQIAQFMAQTVAVLNAVIDGFNSAAGLTNSLISTAQLTVDCGVNIFRSLASVGGLPQFSKAPLMEIGGAYSNALCVLANVFPAQPTFPAYQPLYGSSNCSSTNGGSPPSVFAGLNPFQFTNPQQVPDAVVSSTQATQAMRTMASTDVVLSPPSIATIGNIAGTAAAGLTSTA
jgi:hypothetical protein